MTSMRALFLALLINGTAASGLHATPLDDAIKAIEAGNSPKAVETLGKLAKDGNSMAQFRLGGLYYHGHGVAEDESLAIYWWKKAAASGNAEAMFQIAHAYLFGTTAARSVSDPDREAALWYFQAASAGHAEAAYTLGLLFLAGKGVVEDKTEAVRWFRTAAGKGHVAAQKAAEVAEREIARQKVKR